MGFSILIYRIVTSLYFKGIFLASFFNKKAKLWIEGRKNLFLALETKIKSLPKDKKKYWFHCASVGEFEQARPIIELLKKREPAAIVILTFFSPSGFELRKNYASADIVTYLPSDSPSNAKKMLHVLEPDLVIFIKYEFWYFLLREINKRKIALYLVSAVFRKQQAFFSNWGVLHRKMLSFYDDIFVQDKNSMELLNTIGIKQVILSGDSRFDRVAAIKAENKSLPIIEQFKGEKKVFVVGSSWPEDEKIIFSLWQNYLHPNGWKLIIAPHEIDEQHINKLDATFNKNCSSLLYSTICEKNNAVVAEILIIDNIGLLSSIYKYANAAYIGGGFGKGIHNSLEAAVYGIPVFFGPNNFKFNEAQELKKIGQAFEVKSQEEIVHILTDIDFIEIKKGSAVYFEEKTGATQKIISKITGHQ